MISLSLFTPDLDLYDLNRVEVLRGPQGTLFGSGSLGRHGALHQQPARPVATATADVEVGLSTIDGGDTAAIVRAMLNMPLGDRAALRIVGYYNEMPGYIDAHGPGGTIDEDVNDGERQGGRAGAPLRADRKHRDHAARHLPGRRRRRLQPRGRLEHAGQPVHDDRAAPSTSASASSTRQLDENFDDEFMLGDLTMEFDLGGVVLTSVSSYTDRDILVIRDASQLTGSVTYFNLGGDRRPRCGSNSALRDCDDGRGVHAGTAALPRTTTAASSGSSAASTATSSATTARRCRRRATTTSRTTALRRLPPCGVQPELGAPVATGRSSRDIPYDIKQTPFFAEGTFDIGERAHATRSAGATTTSRRTAC